MEWKNDTRPYSSGENLYLGKWLVGGYHFDSARSRDDPNKYVATCRLPGIKDSLGYFKTGDEAKVKAEFAVTLWLSKVPADDIPPHPNRSITQIGE